MFIIQQLLLFAFGFDFIHKKNETYIDTKGRRRWKRASESSVSACSLPSCVPLQDGLFMEGLHRSLTEKTLIQHILSMFTYRDTGVGGNLRVCVCV